MTAFINGALSALQKCLNLIEILDPEHTDPNMIDMRNQILIYIEMYKNVEKINQENPVKDETWQKIRKASTLSQEQLDMLEEFVAKA